MSSGSTPSFLPKIRPRAVLPAHRLQGLGAKSAWRTYLALASLWGTIFAAMWLYQVVGQWQLALLLVPVIASRQFALVVLMHEGAHGLLHANRKINLWLSQWLCAYPLMTDTVPYRKTHAAHHRHTETPDDPDLVLSRAYPVTKASMMRKIARDLTGIAGVRRYYGFGRAIFTRRKTASLWARCVYTAGKLRGFLITNAVLLAIIAWAFSPWYYLTLWWLPLLTWYSLIYRLRNLAEHAVVPARDPFSVARTTLASPLYRWLIAPLNVNYHVEHHLFPFVPWYRLPKAHRLLMESEHRARIEVGRGYASVIRSAVAPS